MNNDKIKENVIRRFENNTLPNWLNSKVKIYPISIGDFFPYPPKFQMYKNLALSYPIDIENFYNSIQFEYDYNCQFLLDNIDKFFDIYVDMRKVIGLGDVKCEDLIKSSLETFSPYSNKAKELLKKIEELA